MRHQFQTGQTQQINEARHIQTPAQPEENEKRAKQIKRTVPSAAPGQRRDQKCRQHPCVNRRRAFDLVSGFDAHASGPRRAVQIRQNRLRQRGESSWWTLLVTAATTFHPRARLDVLEQREQVRRRQHESQTPTGRKSNCGRSRLGLAPSFTVRIPPTPRRIQARRQQRLPATSMWPLIKTRHVTALSPAIALGLVRRTVRSTARSNHGNQ